MDDQLDKDLSKRIQEVFDNHNDAPADEGWLKLREKFPEERKRRAIIWLWPAAALLLLFIGLGLLMLFNGHKATDHIAGTKPVKQQPIVQHSQKDSTLAANPVSSGASTIVQSNPPAQQLPQPDYSPVRRRRPTVDSNYIAKNQAAQSSVKTNTAVAQNTVNRAATSPTNTGTTAVAVQKPVGADQPAQTNVLPPNITSSQGSPLLAYVDTAKKKSIITRNTPQVAVITKPVIAPKDTTAPKTAVVTKKSSNIDEMFAADQARSPGELKAKTDMRVKFAVYAATYINYAKNGTNQANAGGGFTAAIPLSKNLRLVTGASVNQNSFNYAYGGLNAAAGGSVLAAGTLPFPPGYYSTNNNYRFAAANEVNANTNTPAADYSHSASLLGIDIPLNLQYQFDTRKYPIYVTGGFSSGTFINESYGNVYSNGSTSPTDSYKGLNDFYFARTVNFGFGVGYPLGKSQLIVEPFLKYPITGMGAQQLKFGASGINLKFNFPTKK